MALMGVLQYCARLSGRTFCCCCVLRAQLMLSRKGVASLLIIPAQNTSRSLSQKRMTRPGVLKNLMFGTLHPERTVPQPPDITAGRFHLHAEITPLGSPLCSNCIDMRFEHQQQPYSLDESDESPEKAREPLLYEAKPKHIKTL